MRTRVKVCCIADVEEARLAIQLGADALGVVGPMPSGPGTTSHAAAAEVARSTPPPVATFLLTSETTAEGIADHVRRIRPTVVQVVSHVDPSEYEALDQRVPRSEVARVQVVHVEGPEALEHIHAYADWVDAFLLDSGRPSASVPELGGTGRVHDWSVSAAFVRHSARPVFLAGGLTAANVAEAIGVVRPFGVDLCSGVRTDGRLDETRLAGFMQAVAKAG